MQVHGLVTLLAGVVFDKTRAATLDLDLAVGFLLNVFDIDTLVSDHLGTKVETGNEFEVDWNFFFRPFSLQMFSMLRNKRFGGSLPFQGGHVRPARLHEGDGTYVRRQGSEAPVSSVPQSWQRPLQGPLSSYG